MKNGIVYKEDGEKLMDIYHLFNVDGSLKRELSVDEMILIYAVGKAIKERIGKEKESGKNLKLCPFCGEAGWIMPGCQPQMLGGEKRWMVVCSHCGGRAGDSDTRSGAIRMWNRRWEEDEQVCKEKNKQ